MFFLRVCVLSSLVLLGCSGGSAKPTDGGTVRDSGTANRDAGTSDSGTPCTSSVSGIVYAPNGTLPLSGVDVYVPVTLPPPALAAGVQCTRCAEGLPGGAVAQTVSGSDGHFRLAGIPASTDVTVVVQSGKWRRVLSLPSITACGDTVLAVTDTTLPRSRTDLSAHSTGVDLPRIAIATGNADGVECLPLALGVDLREITTAAQGGAVNLFVNVGATSSRGTDRFQPGAFPSGTDAGFSDAQALWSSGTALASYDLVLFSCEGSALGTTKTQPALDAVKHYADLGGRLMLSHLANVWITGAIGGGGPTQAVWPQVGVFTSAGNPALTGPDVIDEVDNPNGADFADWMLAVQASGSRGEVTLPNDQLKVSALSVAEDHADRWISTADGGAPGAQMLAFTTPNESAPAARCGEVLFSDLHLASSKSGFGDPGYPSKCAALGLPQEKALAYAFFQIGRCVGPK